MAKSIIYTGSQSNDGTGDSLRSGAAKINNNFTEIYNKLGDGAELLTKDLDLGENKIYFKNSVATPTELNSFNGSKYQGMVIHVESEGALYYGTNGTWRKIITDTSDGLQTPYVNPLSTVAYTGRLTDLGIDDGVQDDVLTSNGDGTFSFKSVSAAANTNAFTLEGQVGSYYLNWSNFTNTPSTLQGYGITNAFSGNYNDLSGKPTLFDGDYSSLTNKPTIPEDLSDLTDTTGLVFSKDYNDLTNKPIIPATIDDLGDVSLSGVASGKTLVWNGLQFIPQTPFSGSYLDLSNTPQFSAVATSGDYADLSNTPSAFDAISITNASSIGFAVGVGINEFSSDITLAGNSNLAVPTEKAVKNYVDTAIAGFSAVGNFDFTGSTISTADSSAIIVQQSVQLYSDLNVGNNVIIDNDLDVAGNLTAGEFHSTGTGSPQIISEGDITLTAPGQINLDTPTLSVTSVSFNGNITFVNNLNNVMSVSNGGTQIGLNGSNVEIGSLNSTCTFVNGTQTIMNVYQLVVRTSEPPSPTNGMVTIADGTTWNPTGTGVQTMVVRLGGAWKTIASA